MFTRVDAIADCLAPTKDIRDFYAKIHLSPWLLLTMLGVVVCIQLGIIVPHFPDKPRWVSSLHLLFMFYLYAILSIFLFPPIMVSAMARNIPIALANAFCLILLGVLDRSTHYIWFNVSWGGWPEYVRSNTARASLTGVISVVYWVYWRTYAHRQLGKVSELIPFLWPVKLKTSQIPFGRRLSPTLHGRVLFIKAANQYVEVTTDQHKMETLRMTLGEAIDAMPRNSGLRIHRSYWVPLEVLKSAKVRLETKAGEVRIDGISIPISRGNIKAVQACLS